VPVQPAAGYELLSNVVVMILMFYLAYRLRRPGVLMLVYLYAYVITQFLLFFVRDNVVVTFLGLNWGLKQAQWTSLVVFIILLPITYLVFRYSRPIPKGAVAATYGIPQKLRPMVEKGNMGNEEESGETEAVEDKQTADEEKHERVEG
jgi:phosphatidylglycerol:prolipoprotein diacylglycerol transferase